MKVALGSKFVGDPMEGETLLLRIFQTISLE